MIDKWNHEKYKFTWLMLSETCDESSVFSAQNILYIIIENSSKWHNSWVFQC
jgi:hypothetical protein